MGSNDIGFRITLICPFRMSFKASEGIALHMNGCYDDITGRERPMGGVSECGRGNFLLRVS